MVVDLGSRPSLAIPGLDSFDCRGNGLFAGMIEIGAVSAIFGSSPFGQVPLAGRVP